MKDAPIWLRSAIETARRRDASDLHLSPGLPASVRIDGTLVALDERPVDGPALCALAESLFEPRVRATLERDGDATGSFDDPDLGALRVHALRAMGGYAIAIRLLGRRIPPLETLGLPHPVEALAECARGLVLLAGPTGSGKSTTMAAIVERMNERSARRILTIEDPIEYRYRSRRSVVTQREVGRDTPRLDRALLGALRADPDTIVVGEMRDAPTMAGVLSAAETGHLVIATVHTGDAAQAVDRIVDAFGGAQQEQIRAQLASVLVAVVAQQLVLRRGGRGRLAAVEVLLGSDGVRALIRDRKSHQLRNAMATGRHLGMQTMEQHLAQLEREGRIDPLASARRPSLPGAAA